MRDRADSLLVLGGARSGKSRFAQQEAERSPLELVFVATAQAFDTEMEQRITAHAAARDARWTLVEAPLGVPEALARTGPGRLLLVDCMTLWLSNILLRGDDLEPAIRALADAAARINGPVIFVSNEVGSGIVPDNALSRAFRDAQGRLNQALADACERVVLVVAGLPLWLKPPATFRPDVQGKDGS